MRSVGPQQTFPIGIRGEPRVQPLAARLSVAAARSIGLLVLGRNRPGCRTRDQDGLEPVAARNANFVTAPAQIFGFQLGNQNCGRRGRRFAQSGFNTNLTAHFCVAGPFEGIRNIADLRRTRPSIRRILDHNPTYPRSEPRLGAFTRGSTRRAHRLCGRDERLRPVIGGSCRTSQETRKAGGDGDRSGAISSRQQAPNLEPRFHSVTAKVVKCCLL